MYATLRTTYADVLINTTTTTTTTTLNLFF